MCAYVHAELSYQWSHMSKGIFCHIVTHFFFSLHQWTCILWIKHFLLSLKSCKRKSKHYLVSKITFAYYQEFGTGLLFFTNSKKKTVSNVNFQTSIKLVSLLTVKYPRFIQALGKDWPGCTCLKAHMTYMKKIQSTLVISNSLISSNRLSRSENLAPVLTKRATKRQQNIVEKRRNCSLGAISPLFHNIFNIFLNLGVKLHIHSV